MFETGRPFLAGAPLLVILCLFCRHRDLSAQDAKEVLKPEDVSSWEDLLQKGTKPIVSPPPRVADMPPPRPVYATDELGREWSQTLEKAGYVPPPSTEEKWVRTRYAKTGSVQSEKLFIGDVLRKLRWYALDGTLIFEGDLIEGRLVHRRRFSPEGVLQSEWWITPEFERRYREASGEKRS